MIDVLLYLQLITLSLFLSIIRSEHYERKIVFLLIFNFFLITVIRFNVKPNTLCVLEKLEWLVLIGYIFPEIIDNEITYKEKNHNMKTKVDKYLSLSGYSNVN